MKSLNYGKSKELILFKMFIYFLAFYSFKIRVSILNFYIYSSFLSKMSNKQFYRVRLGTAIMRIEIKLSLNYLSCYLITR